jgi:arginine/lysine/histidine/glutamine transport system substrate-binding/permease protein
MLPPPRRLAVLLLSLVLALGLGLAGPGRATPVWTVGTDPTYAPFGMADGASGELRGFDIDLIQAIAQRSGHRLQLTPLPFDGLIPALQARNLDLAISAMTITAERAETVDFSRPYFAAGLGIVVREGTRGINTLKDLEGRTIAVQIGSTGAKAMAAVPRAQLSTFDSAPLALQELLNGNVEAYVNDLPATLYAIETADLKGIEIAGKPITADFYGIAFPKGSPLQAPVNQALGQVLADGSYARIYQRWFGQAPPPLPQRAPALDSRSGQAGLDGVQLLRNLVRGAGVTLALTLCSFALGLIGAALVATGLLKPNPLVQRCCRVYVDFFRGTPILVQLFVIYFGVPALAQQLGLSIQLDRFAAAVLALGLNGAAYLAETLRAGILSIDRGQWEAAKALGLRPLPQLRWVILPQALQRVLPSLANEFITLIKDTSLAAVIGFDELFRQGQLVVATSYRAFEVYLAVALVYLVMTTAASLLFKQLERRLRRPA